MPTLKLYIETSVWWHFLADDDPPRRKGTRGFFRCCRRAKDKVRLFVSEEVLRAMRAFPSAEVNGLDRLLAETSPTVLPILPEAVSLARAYAEHGAIPAEQSAIALHAATAAVHELDVIVSWRHRELVNMVRRRKIQAVNMLMGYNRVVDIVVPPAVFGAMVVSRTQREIWKIRAQLGSAFSTGDATAGLLP
jgi:predicted nucleic acid-binding protein